MKQIGTALGAHRSTRVAWVFGSFARGEPFRDLDVAVWFERAIHWSEPGELATRVWETLGRPGFEVEVQVLNDATAEFLERVTRDGLVVFERSRGDAMELATLALSRLIDQREWQRIHGSES